MRDKLLLVSRRFRWCERGSTAKILSRSFEQQGKEYAGSSGQDALPLDWPEDISPEQAKDISITSLAGSAFKLLPYLIGKSWMILKTEGAKPFYISDLPVVLQNLTNPGDTVRGTLGVGVKGIEIYLPLSSKFCLLLLCSWTADLLRESKTRSAAMLDGAEPIPLEPLDVMNVNHLQVKSSLRFVYCEKPEFALVQDMLARDLSTSIG